jgi:hypothetical protein
MKREEQIKEYISTFIEQYAESVDCHPKEVEHFGNFIRIGINWADRHPKDEVNWQQVRIQASIAAMQGVLSNPDYVRSVEHIVKNTEQLRERVATISTEQADALVKELKGE